MNQSGTVRVNIKTYLAGLNQPTHPSIVYFDKPWNGYKYWMTYSPYPYGNGEEENPCIAVSNDMYYWDTPRGLANPIAYNEETGCNELKDPHILYRNDLDRLEIWYMGRLSINLGGDGKTLLIFRKTSIDGVHWSSYEILTETEYLSPSVVWEDGKYKLWEIGFTETTQGRFAYRESLDGITWTPQKFCSLNDKTEDIHIWHGSVNHIHEYFHFVFIAEMQNSQSIMHCISKDGISFSCPQKLITLTNTWSYFYRPFLLYDNDQFWCIYGVVNRDHSWYLSESHGKTIEHLSGLSDSDIGKMIPLSDKVKKTDSIFFYLRKYLKLLNSSSHLELFLLIIPLLVCTILFGENIIIPCGVIVSILCIGYTTRLKKDNLDIFCIKVLTSLFEATAIIAITLMLFNII